MVKIPRRPDEELTSNLTLIHISMMFAAGLETDYPSLSQPLYMVCVHPRCCVSYGRIQLNPFWMNVILSSRVTHWFQCVSNDHMPFLASCYVSWNFNQYFWKLYIFILVVLSVEAAAAVLIPYDILSLQIMSWLKQNNLCDTTWSLAWQQMPILTLCAVDFFSFAFSSCSGCVIVSHIGGCWGAAHGFTNIKITNKAQTSTHLANISYT